MKLMVILVFGAILLAVVAIFIALFFLPEDDDNDPWCEGRR